ncbi:hypothetical protein [Streptomyces sp. NPDC055299]
MHFRILGSLQAGLDGAMLPLAGLIERRLLDLWRGAALADWRTAIRTGPDRSLWRASGWAPWGSTSTPDRRSATTMSFWARRSRRCRGPAS